MAGRYLVVASNRAPNLQTINKCLQPLCSIYEYDYDKTSLNDILVGVHRHLSGRKVNGMAFLLRSTQSAIFLCGPGEYGLNEESTAGSNAITSFFAHIVRSHLELNAGRIDFFGACLGADVAADISRNLQNTTRVEERGAMGIYGDYLGGDSYSGKCYFVIEKLNENMARTISAEEKLEGYEKIRTVGKGAFGTAILYRNTVSDCLVVIKEINMMELTASERQMALNEVQVLSVLNHPNIVSYFRSFERDGILMIEMEYADGGTLAQMLARLSRPLPERDILEMFSQITAAIRHMHQHNILHRDLKTANVFLTKNNTIKVGDFGISKAMATKAQAQTVLGTPYYISPEMCEGKQYGQKSDIWALGCILYEMACLKKPFQGSSLPALVNNIMKGSFPPIPAFYSVSFKHLMNQLLQREPNNRPTAGELIQVMIPRTIELLSRQETLSSINSVSRNINKERSLLYEITGFGQAFEMLLVPLPPQIKIIQIAVSSTHYMAVSSDLTVFTWGTGEHGELGHGDKPRWRSTPTHVTALGDHSIRAVAAGTGFSLFVSDSGMLLSCGDGSNGCLGHGDANSLEKPKLIEKLLQVDVICVSCGPKHVVALSSDGNVHVWGSGEDGRLGLHHERMVFVPTVVDINKENSRNMVVSVHCGEDCTIALINSGILYACGNNAYNKIGLNTSSLFFGSQIIGKSTKFRKVTSLRGKIEDVSMGANHTVLLTSQGIVITMGSNEEGQLGHTGQGPNVVRTIADYAINFVSAGPSYTLAATVENLLLMWGTVSNNDASTSRSQLNIMKRPTEILALYSSPSQLQAGNNLCIGGILGSKRGLFTLVHTSTPLQAQGSNMRAENGLGWDGDTDSIGTVPEWIKADVADSEAPWGGYTNSFTNTSF